MAYQNRDGNAILYRDVMTEEDREHPVGNTVDHPGGAQKRIRMRQTALFYKADPDYGRRVAEWLGLDVKDIGRLVGLSQEEQVKTTAQET